MTYTETLQWMFAQLPMYQKQGKTAFKGKLDNIEAFCTHLGHPEQKFKSIHVGGTNGKGSSSHMLASVLQEAGYKVGLYTSPHLKDFRERIKINGVPLPEDFVIHFIGRNKVFLEAYGLSFFEMTVGMAFDYFVREEVDIAIIEVGLGGRLDSTNVIHPEVSLITNVGYDHVEFLGDTLEKIAAEKAGIIKSGTPVVISEFQKESAPVFAQKAQEMHAKITFAGQLAFPHYTLGLQGGYQRNNVKGVLGVLQELKGFQVSQKAIAKGLQEVVENTGLLGRWQELGVSPKIVCDTAHNTEGLRLVMGQLLEEDYRELHMVLGFVKDKSLDTILPLFPQNAHYYFCSPDVPRGLEVDQLKRKANAHGLQGNSYSSVNEALEAAKSKADSSDFIYVGGSTFVVAEVV